MKATVVTISQQLGAGTNEIARAVAERLNFRYYDRDVVARAAEASGVSPDTVAQSERWPGFFERMIETLSRTAIITDGITQPWPGTMLTMGSADYRRLVERVVREIAARGNCVILGHAGQVVLKDNPRVLRVLIHGSIDRRIDDLRNERRISMVEARDAVLHADRQRDEFFRHVYVVEWLNPALYDLTIQIDRLSPQEASDTIVTAAGVSAAVPVPMT